MKKNLFYESKGFSRIKNSIFMNIPEGYRVEEISLTSGVIIPIGQGEQVIFPSINVEEGKIFEVHSCSVDYIEIKRHSSDGECLQIVRIDCGSVESITLYKE